MVTPECAHGLTPKGVEAYWRQSKKVNRPVSVCACCAGPSTRVTMLRAFVLVGEDEIPTSAGSYGHGDGFCKHCKPRGAA